MMKHALARVGVRFFQSNDDLAIGSSEDRSIEEQR